jgi:hypothetical protein
MIHKCAARGYPKMTRCKSILVGSFSLLLVVVLTVLSLDIETFTAATRAFRIRVFKREFSRNWRDL